MRKEEFSVGDYIHVYNRGNRKQNIFIDEKDMWRFLQGLRFFNDSHSSTNALRNILQERRKKWLISDTNQFLRMPESVFQVGWPKDWPEKDPLVKILCYCLMPNHFHLLLQEIREGGISKFMQKLGIGYTNYFNLRHRETGKVFQGGYKCRTVRENQFYLEYLSVYIQVKNVLELFPGGIEEALKDIDKAFEFAEIYKFSSFPDFIGKRESLIIEKDILGDIFPTPEDYKKFAKEIIESKKYNMLEELKIDEK
ncbi:MAG: transposase [Candidatus Pacebacteria bacterium]|nr:transposase [Candidatus Paceibacterota bacterium]